MRKNACNILVVHDKKILLGHRRTKYANGLWCLPGGHVKKGEIFEECGFRELYEETGVIDKNQKYFLTIGENVKKDTFFHHFLCIKIGKRRGDWFVNKEPEKFYEWSLFDYNNIPAEIITTHKLAIDYFFLELKK